MDYEDTKEAGSARQSRPVMKHAWPGLRSATGYFGRSGVDARGFEAAGMPRQEGNVETKLVGERANLAIGRSALAAERTLLSWVRTALSMIAFGFIIGRLGQAAEEIQLRGSTVLLGGHTAAVESVGCYLVVLGTSALVFASVQHWAMVRQLRAMGLPAAFSLAMLTAILLTPLGGGAFVALVFKL